MAVAQDGVGAKHYVSHFLGTAFSSAITNLNDFKYAL
jgi:hypothetical protein